MGRSARRLAPALLLGLLTGCLSAYLQEKTPREGHEAPPIEGVDARGQVIRLREHAGKVILLSFWHSQCPPCRAMFPHEMALVKKYAGKPFVLLGVNADESPFALARTQEKAGLTWASFWDGSGGPISREWSVEQFPTFFLIDRQGLVRLRHVGIPPEGLLERKIAELLEDAEKKQKRT